MYKVMMDKLDGCIFSLKKMTLKKYNTVWNKVRADIKKLNFASIIKNF